MISLRQVAVHNLKNIDIDLPLGKLIVFCGRSGSGKSSLAIDTLYAEGQRQYIETFSPAMRLFLEKVEKPKAERLDGIPPAIAVVSASRKMDTMTVGDATEVNDYLAMLFAQIGHVFCPKCSRPITSDTPQSVWQRLNDTVDKGAKLQIAFAPPLENSSAEFADIWKEQGFLRGCYRDDGRQTADSRLLNSGDAVADSPLLSAVRCLPSFRLDEPIPDELYRPGLLLIVDRLTFDPDEEDRFIESLEAAFDYGCGKCFVLLEQQTLPFSQPLSCEFCNIHVPPLTPKLFRTDWINHVHLYANVNSPTISDLSRMTIADLIRFFEELLPCRENVNSEQTEPDAQVTEPDAQVTEPDAQVTEPDA